MASLRACAETGLFQLNEVSDMGVLPDMIVRPKPCEWTDGRALVDSRVLRNCIRGDFHPIGNTAISENASGPDHRVFSDNRVSEQLSERLDDRIHANLDLRIHEYGFRTPYRDSLEHQFARFPFAEDVIDNRKFDPGIDSKEFVSFGVQQSAH